MRLQALQRRAHALVEEIDEGDPLNRFAKLFIVVAIVLSVVSVILETVVWLHERYEACFYAFEAATVVIFSVEYALRVWSCVADPRYRRPILGRLRFMLTPMALVDLVSVVPFYLAWSIDLRFLRALRLARLLRILKLGRYSESVDLLYSVLRGKKEDMIAASSGAVLLLVVCSSLMYFAEGSVQPRVFSSIPAAMWWGVTTLTTVGYGDVYPVTILGKVIAGATAIVGVGLFALPAGILAAGFMAEVQRRHHAGEKTCPHCGKPL